MSKFELAAQAIRDSDKHGAKMTDQEGLKLYGYYKQATLGDNKNEKPGVIHLKERKKHEAWFANQGMSKEEAESKYVDLAVGMLTKYNVQVPEALK